MKILCGVLVVVAVAWIGSLVWAGMSGNYILGFILGMGALGAGLISLQVLNFLHAHEGEGP